MSTPPSGLSGDTGAGQPAQRPPAEVANVLKSAVPAAQEPGDSGLTGEEERELARLQAKAAEARAEAGAVGIKVDPDGPHSGLIFGGIELGREEFTKVPPQMVGPLTTAADNAGVKIIQEG